MAVPFPECSDFIRACNSLDSNNYIVWIVFVPLWNHCQTFKVPNFYGIIKNERGTEKMNREKRLNCEFVMFFCLMIFFSICAGVVYLVFDQPHRHIMGFLILGIPISGVIAFVFLLFNGLYTDDKEAWFDQDDRA